MKLQEMEEMAHWGHSRSLQFGNVILVIIPGRTKYVGMWGQRVQAYTGFGGETWGKGSIEIPR